MHKNVVYVLNESGFFGIIIVGLTNNVTGSLFLTMMMIFILFIVTALAMRMPPIVASIVFLPFLLTLASISSDYLSIVGIVLLYLGYTLAVLIYPGSY